MPIKTNMTSLEPRRQAYKQEVTLLSRGFSNPQAWPDGKITIYPWDSDVDDFLVNGLKKYKGNFLYGILEQVCNLNGATVDQFVFSEINSILLLARAIQFDGVVEYQSECPYCGTTDRENIKIPHELQPIGEKQPGYLGYDDITLPKCKDVVRIRPLLVRDQKKMEEMAATNEKVSLHILQIIVPIIAVNGTQPDNLEEVYQYYKALAPKDAAHLEEQESKLTPRLDNRIPHQCKKCSKKFFHTLMFDQEFFPSGGTGEPTPAAEETVPVGVGRQGVPNRPAKSK